ncbi:MAG TPA: hypothetical protein VGO26_06800 [Amnibacterium sp.]|nr:hypothetical protein [Amnibacterium sp.]
MTALATAAPVWCRLHRHLWVGHADLAPLGSIEHCRRYTYIPPDSTAYGDFRGPLPIVAPARDGLRSDQVQQRLLIACSIAATVALALVGPGMLLFA